jgi:alpha-N-arabinofuranosidase
MKNKLFLFFVFVIVNVQFSTLNSFFTWFPGLPVYHSRDLTNWELAGHAINRPGMIDLKSAGDRFHRRI